MGENLVVLAGNLGVGKTTIAGRIARELNWHLGLESVGDNPYLSDFYADMSRWSFHLQIHFMSHRVREHLRAANQSKSAVLDRSVYEDAHVFSVALRDLGLLEEREFASYQSVFGLVRDLLPCPSLIVQLVAPAEVLRERILKRNQGFDSSVSVDYLKAIEVYYTRWIEGVKVCPVMIWDTHDSDLVGDQGEWDRFIEALHRNLGAGRG